MLQGLREFPSSVIVPMMQISWTMFSILSGGIYFHEYRVFTAFTGTMFALGVAVRPAQCVNMACLYPRAELERCRQKRRMSRMDCSSLPGFLTPVRVPSRLSPMHRCCRWCAGSLSRSDVRHDFCECQLLACIGLWQPSPD